MQYRPLYDHVLAKQIVHEAKSSFGIILNSTGVEETTTATVVAVGAGSKNSLGKIIPVGVNVGDVVSFSPDAAVHRVTLDGTEYLVMRKDCILGVQE